MYSKPELMTKSLHFLSFLVMFHLLIVNLAKAQLIDINEDFNSAPVNSLPPEWNSEELNPFQVLNSPNSCAGRGATDSVSSNSTNTTASLTTPIRTSNGTAVNVSFDFKVVYQDYTAISGNWGNLYFEYKIGNGNWLTYETINSSNYVSSNICTNKSFTMPANLFPTGQNVQFRFRDVYGSPALPFYVIIDNVSIQQTPAGPPNCDAYLISPLNGATNVPVTTNQLTWSDATGGATNYRISMGTSPGGTQIANNIDLGNVNSYVIPVQLQYATTYYVRIVPTNNSGPASGCIEQSFTTEPPITTTRPWEEPFPNTSTPIGWNKGEFAIGNTNRFPVNGDAPYIWKQISSSDTFTTISVGLIQAGDLLTMNYAFGPYTNGNPPPSTGAGNFQILISTDHGITYPTIIGTVSTNGTSNWQEFLYDLSPFVGQYAKIKITANSLTGPFAVAFDNFYIGQEITCERAENVELVYVGTNSAQASWDAVAGASGYDWMVFLDGADPETETPLLSGNTVSTSVTMNDLTPGTEYDFYVRTNCGGEGQSYLSLVLNFKTKCTAISNFPYFTSFEEPTLNQSCWENEYVIPGINPLGWRLMEESDTYSIISAHEGVQYALFQRENNDGNTTKLVSPPLDLSSVSEPRLSFWYVNFFNSDPEIQSINTLRIYYKTSPNGAWVALSPTYQNNVTNWTQIEFELPNPSSEYYIAFEGVNNWGSGIGIDSVEIYDDYTCPFETTWDGWSWSNGPPNEDTKAIINGDWVLTSDLTVCQIEVTAQGSIEIPSNLTLTVVDRITNLATAGDFIVQNEANLLQERDVLNLGEITVHRIGNPYKRLDYTIWSSPVLGQQLKAFSPMTVNNRIMTYNGTDGYVEVPNIYANFLPGQGVLFRAPNNWSSTTPAPYHGVFTGVPQNGEYTYPTFEGSYTSIGNPYPSNLDSQEFFLTNPKAEALYFWTNVNPVENGSYSGFNYATINLAGETYPPVNGGSNETPNGIISVGQGFVVLNSTAEVLFNNSMRTDNTAPFFKGGEPERHRFWLNLTDQDNYGFNQIMMAYMTGATEGIDTQMDAKMMNYNGAGIFHLIEEKRFTIQSRPLPFNIHDRITLGFKSDHNGKFKISLAKFDGLFAATDVQIYIKDLKDQTVHCLSDSPFEFEGMEGVELKRFEVFYLPEFVNLNTAEFAADGIILYKNREYIEILSEFENMDSVEIFDLSGRKLWSEQHLNSDKHSILSSYFGSQVLLIQVKLQNGKMISKKWVN